MTDQATNGGPPDTVDADDALYEEVERRALRDERLTPAQRAEQMAEMDEELGRPPPFDPEREEYMEPDRPADRMFRWSDYAYASLRRVKQGPLDVCPTPLPSLNRMFLYAGGGKGIAHGWHCLVAASSSIGKTNTILNFLVHFMRAGERVAYLGLEEEPEQVGTRIAAIAAGRRLSGLMRGRHYDTDGDRLAARTLTELPGEFFQNREPIYDVEDIVAIMADMASLYGVRTFAVDYLQLARQGGSHQRMVERISEISTAVRATARRKKLISLCASQLNRSASTAKDRCPTIYDLMGSSQLENDADVILLLDHCEEHFHDRRQQHGHVDTRMILGKNKMGPVGNLRVRFDHSTSRVLEVDPRFESIVQPTDPRDDEDLQAEIALS